MKKIIILFLSLIISLANVEAQELKQIIRGRVTDLDSKTPLIGVNLYIEGSQPVIGTITDENGYFIFKELPVGRYNIGLSYIGYESKVIPNILIGAGKETVLNVEIEESVRGIAEVVVKARKNKGEPLNEMATVSARSITVEETQRFAGSFNDPSRLVSSYAGVMGNPDGSNDLIVRGNSPRGIQWRLEGIDIPNPNHFANEGATGGPISILNNSTLGNCDFFTGAFPADYGEAYSGVFDIHLRKGNNRKHEFSAQAGMIGVDFTAEGPFTRNGQASYLINYRYSSLDLMNRTGIKIEGDAVPKFQDMTFNIMMPAGKFGTFQLVGIGGLSTISFDESDYRESYDADLGAVGLNHIYAFGDKTYLKTSFSLTGTVNDWKYFEHQTDGGGWEMHGRDDFVYLTYSMGVQLTHKLSANHTFKAGITSRFTGYDLTNKIYDYDADVLYTSIEDEGNSEIYQSFVNWKFRPVYNLTFNTGIHAKYFTLNGNYAIEPRIGARWQISPKQAFTAGFGLHSKTDNISLYLFRERLEDGTLIQHNKNLDFLRARHYILGYENRLTEHLNMKAEIYYQDLYNVPVTNEENTFISILNATNGYILGKMVNEGSGKTYGLEVSMDKYFASNYYFIVTTSLFESKFKAYDGIERNLRFNNNYIINAAGGKEIPLGKMKQSAMNINLRVSYAGGQWYTPIDEESSRTKGYTVRDYNQALTGRRPEYLRMDIKIGYRKNKKKTTRILELDVQNVTNQQNITGDYWNAKEDKIETYSQLGIIPVLNYRIEF